MTMMTTMTTTAAENVSLVAPVEITANIKNLYTPPGAWHGKIYGMAWPYFFPLDAVHKPHTTQKNMNIKKYYK